MKTAQHTPGPWTVTPHPHLPIARVHRGPHDPAGVPICAVNMRSLAALSESGDSEDEANARLIAAAPDLLHALKWAAEYVSLHTPNGAGWTGVQQGHDRERFIDDDTGNFDAEGLRTFLAETITKAEEG